MKNKLHLKIAFAFFDGCIIYGGCKKDYSDPTEQLDNTSIETVKLWLLKQQSSVTGA